jgi:hypothetical protein
MVREALSLGWGLGSGLGGGGALSRRSGASARFINADQYPPLPPPQRASAWIVGASDPMTTLHSIFLSRDAIFLARSGRFLLEPPRFRAFAFRRRALGARGFLRSGIGSLRNGGCVSTP